MYKKIATIVAVTVLVLFVASCGGGGSSSGTAQDNNVTSCVAIMDITNSVDLVDRTYTNTCDFAINLGLGIVAISRVETLSPGQSFTQLLLSEVFIACRAPSTPFDADSSASKDFQCTQ